LYDRIRGFIENSVTLKRMRYNKDNFKYKESF
jgi:hypothetical protein